MRVEVACAVVVATACSRPPQPTPIANTTTAAPLTVTSHGVGPIDESTPMQLASLRAAFPGYDVTPIENGGFDVARGGEKLLYVVTYDGKLHSVHVTSARIPVEGKPWRVGQRFDDAASFELCQCGDDDDLPMCTKPGPRIAIVVRHKCDMSPAQHVGAPIVEVVWSPHAFGD